MPLRRICLLLAVGALFAPRTWCGIHGDEYALRRARLASAVDSASAFVFRAADARSRSGDITYPYRQESNFLYLTGITEPGCTLVIIPRGMKFDGVQESVFLLAPVTALEHVRAIPFTGGQVVNADRLPDLLNAAAAGMTTLYVSMPDVGFINDWLNNRPLFLDQESRQQFQRQHEGVKIRNAGPQVARLRECKSDAELDLMRTAIRLTGDGILKAAETCRPGAVEYEIQAAVEYAMTAGGARAVSFPSIIGSGPNSTILHYDVNTRTMHAGDVVVVDVGAEYDGYAADVTRTFPVSGAFTKEQREIYNVVLRAQEAVIGIIRPGIRWNALEATAREVIAAGGFGGRMPHAVSHHLGIDAHDAGTYDTLKAGMVITVEPGVYIPQGDTTVSRGYRGVGIRIEDDVLVGEKGPVVLSQKIPRDVRSIEALTNKSISPTHNHQRRVP